MTASTVLTQKMVNQTGSQLKSIKLSSLLQPQFALHLHHFAESAWEHLKLWGMFLSSQK